MADSHFTRVDLSARAYDVAALIDGAHALAERGSGGDGDEHTFAHIEHLMKLARETLWPLIVQIDTQQGP
jgi:hypothetical protein